jgi:hypothetical protein
MTENAPDFQLTSDDPMLERIEAATSHAREVARDEARATTSSSESAQAPVAEPNVDTYGPLDPGEPESARFEPDASQ